MKLFFSTLLFISFKISAETFFTLPPLSYDEAIKKCQLKKAKLATLSQAETAINEKKVKLATKENYWAISDKTPPALYTVTAMSAGLTGARPSDKNRGVIYQNNFGLPISRYVFLCSEKLEEGEETCNEYKNIYASKLSGICRR